MTTPDWENASDAFAGWVPTIFGHLSFSLIGSRLDIASGELLNRNGAPDHTRSIIALSRRFNTDTGLPAMVARKIFPDLEQTFLMIGHAEAHDYPSVSRHSEDVNTISDSLGALRGTITVFGHQTNKERQIEQQEFFRTLKADIIRWNDGTRTAPSAMATAPSDVRRRIAATNFKHWTVEFAIFRTGEVRIWTNVKDLESAALETGARQCFYFIKDIAHYHTHHDGKADQLVPLCCTRASNGAIESDDKGWRRETLWGMARVIDELCHRAGLESQKKALGIIAYADAFQTTLAKVEREGKTFKYSNALPSYDFRHARESLRAIIDQRSYLYAARAQLYVLLVTVILASAGLWYGFVSIKSTLCADLETLESCPKIVAPTATWTVSWIVSHPMTFLILFALSAVSIFSIVMKDADRLPLINSLATFFLRPVYAMSTSISLYLKRSSRTAYFILITTLVLMVLVSARTAYFALDHREDIRAVAERISARYENF